MWRYRGNQHHCEMGLKYFFVLLLVVVQVSAQNGLQDCPSNIPRTNHLTSFGDYCLQFVHTERSWGDARHDCLVHGGDLIQIKDLELQSYTVNKLHALHWDKKGVWIGATDRDKEGVWEWATGEALTYGNWHHGQGPSQEGFFFSSGFQEDCALLRLDDGGLWHDYPCRGGIAYHYTYICQYNKVIKPVTVPLVVKETDQTDKTITKGPIITETAAPSRNPVTVEQTTESSNTVAYVTDTENRPTKTLYEKQKSFTSDDRSTSPIIIE